SEFCFGQLRIRDRLQRAIFLCLIVLVPAVIVALSEVRYSDALGKLVEFWQPPDNFSGKFQRGLKGLSVATKMNFEVAWPIRNCGNGVESLAGVSLDFTEYWVVHRQYWQFAGLVGQLALIGVLCLVPLERRGPI